MTDCKDEGLAWQVGVWDRMADVYQRDIDSHFGPVIKHLLDRANLKQPLSAMVLDGWHPIGQD